MLSMPDTRFTLPLIVACTLRHARSILKSQARALPFHSVAEQRFSPHDFAERSVFDDAFKMTPA